MRFLKNGGFSLLELTIATAGMCIGAYYFSDFMINQKKIQEVAENKNEIESIQTQIKSTMSSQLACNMSYPSFGTSNINIYSCPTDKSTDCSLAFESNKLYGLKKNLKIASFILDPQESTPGLKKYQVTYQILGKNNEIHKQIMKKLTFNVTTVGSATTCYSAEKSSVKSTCTSLGGTYNDTTDICNVNDKISETACKATSQGALKWDPVNRACVSSCTPTQKWDVATYSCVIDCSKFPSTVQVGDQCKTYTEAKCPGRGSIVNSNSCAIAGASCPNGWVFTGETTTQAVTGKGGSTTSCNDGHWCTTGSHAFSVNATESCFAATNVACGPATSGGVTYDATVIQVGCRCDNYTSCQ